MKERTIENKNNVDVIETPNLYGWRGVNQGSQLAGSEELWDAGDLDNNEIEIEIKKIKKHSTIERRQSLTLQKLKFKI